MSESSHSSRPISPSSLPAPADGTGLIRIRGARQHNLKNLDLDILQELEDSGKVKINC